MTALFVDSSVLLVAFGGEHPERETCRRLVDAGAEGRYTAHASVETIQEVVFHRMRRAGGSDAVAIGRLLAGSSALHPFDVEVLARSTDLIESTAIRGRDAVIAATALLAGFAEIVSLDGDFDLVSGLTRLTPAQALESVGGPSGPSGPSGP